MADLQQNNSGGGTKRDFAAFLDDEQVLEKYRWRGNPEATFSDWKIEVVPKRDGVDSADSAEDPATDTATIKTTTKTYHVHRTNIGYGPRSSAYFRGLLLRSDDQFSESTDSTSRIELHPLAAEAFPELLDYVYSTDEKLKVGTHTATALCFMGDYFGIQGISEQAKDYCQGDLSLDNVENYLEHAMIFQNSAILETVTAFVGRHIDRIQPSSSIVKMADPDFWLKVWDSVSADARSRFDSGVACSEHMSLIAAENLSCHNDNVQLGTLHRLTAARNLPNIHRNAALPLCQAENNLMKKDPSVNGEAGDQSLSMSGVPELSDLQKRCASSLHGAWIKEAISDSEKEALCQMKAPFLVDLLIHYTQLKRHRSIEELEEKHQEELSKYIKRLRRRNDFIKCLRTDMKQGQLRVDPYTESTKLPYEYVRQHSGKTKSDTYVHRPKIDFEYPVFFFASRKSKHYERADSDSEPEF